MCVLSCICVCVCVCLCVCQTLALAVPVWGGPLVLANSVWSYLLCFMFLASRGHKQPFVAKRWLVSLQTDPCSCSPLLDISMCVRACVCGYMCASMHACMSVLLSVSVCNDTCVLCIYVWVSVCIYVCTVWISVCVCVHSAVLQAEPTMLLSFKFGDFDPSKSSPVTFSVISFEWLWVVRLQVEDRQTLEDTWRSWIWLCSIGPHVRTPA